MSRIIEGLWDCMYCGTKEIGGSKRECPNCGKPRDNEIKFYLPNSKSQRKYLSLDEAAKINKRPDWICAYCNSLNSDNEKICISCGSARTSENEDYFSNSRKIEERIFEDAKRNEYYSNSEEVVEVINNFDEVKSENIFFKIGSFIKEHRMKFIIAGIVLLLLTGLIFLITPYEKEVTIQSVGWERTINVERFQTVNESDWYLPSGARLQYSQQEIKGYEEVFDHYETRTRQVQRERISGYEEYVVGTRDLGNGYFEEITAQRPVYETYWETETYQEAIYRTEPIYAPKYYYEIDKWLFERSVKTSGYDKSPYFGEVNLKSDEREGSKSERYFIVYETDKNANLSFEDWNTLDVGETVKLKMYHWGSAELILN